MPFRWPLLGAVLLLGACGSSDDGPGHAGGIGGGSDALSTAAGIYYGQIGSGSSAPTLFGLVAPDGKARFVETDGDVYRVISTAPLLPAADGGFTVGFYRYSNGRRDARGTLQGQLADASIAGTLDDGSSARSYALDAVSRDYDRPAALATLAGTYSASYSVDGQNLTLTLAVDADGSISGDDGASCRYTGSVRVPDPAHNGYEVRLEPSCALGRLDGLGAYYPGSLLGLGPDRFRLVVSNDSFGFYLVLTRAS